METTQDARTQRRWKPTEGPLEHSDEWYDVRRYDPDRERPVVITASQAAAACGQSRYETPLDVFVQARRGLHVRHVSEEDQARLRRGLLFQPLFLREYAEEQGVKVVEPKRLYYHPTLQFMAATPDGLALPEDSDEWLVEAKGTSHLMHSRHAEDDRYGESGTDEVPTEILLQAQQQMAVMDLHRCDVVAFFGLFVMRVYPIARSDEIIKAIVDAERELAERIANDDPPDPSWSHPNTRALLQDIHGFHTDEAVTLDDEAANDWWQYRHLGDEIKARETLREELRNKVLAAMAGATFAHLSDDSHVRRIRVSETVYTEADVESVRQKVGQTKRRGYEMLRERKAKQ